GGALLGQREGNTLSNALPCTGHDRHLAVQNSHCRLLAYTRPPGGRLVSSATIQPKGLRVTRHWRTARERSIDAAIGVLSMQAKWEIEMRGIIDVDAHFEPGEDWLEPYPKLKARLPPLQPALLAVETI